MDDVISRQELLKRTTYDPLHVPYISTQDVLDCPSAQHKPFCYLDSPCPYQNEEIKVMQKKWHWVYPTDVKGFCRCEHCGALWGRDLYENRFFKYCPRCGADMRGENDV